MADLTYENALKAMRKAHDAGRVDDAKRMAALAKRLQGEAQASGGGQVMRQVNRGIVDAAGGLVDFINPFDEWTGSAKTGLENLAEKTGVELAGEPETAWQGFQQGAGQAAASLVPVAKGLQALRGVGGAVGQFADDAYRTLAGYVGAGTETVAGGLSEAGRTAAENAGAPEWVQDTAAIAAPMSLAGVVPAAKAAGRATMAVGKKLPISGPAFRMAEQLPGKVAAAAAPYTKTGGRQVAHERAVELAGGKERADALATQMRGENPLGLTPAELTNDPGMLAIQQEAARQDPALAARLTDRAESASRAARQQIGGMGGDVEDAQAFLGERLRRFKVNMEAKATTALERTARGVQNVGTARELPGDNSSAIMGQVDEALRAAKVEEKALWDRVPMDVTVDVNDARAVAQSWERRLGATRAHDIPTGVRRFLLEDNDAIAETASVLEMHGLYSDLRQAARNARAGTNTNPTLAKVADEVADAILADLGAVDGATPVGRAINAARDASRQIHETFDQGAIGRLMRKTNAGDTATDPQLALERTIGRGGTQAMVADEQITAAAGERARPFVADYLKGSFGEKAFDANGNFTRAGANGFLRSNKELLQRYPELRRDIVDAVGERLTAEDFAERVGAAVKAAQNARQSAAARFVDVAPEKALDAILSDKAPARAAAKIVAQARKDDTGRALAGVKGAVSRRLIDQGFKVKNNRLKGDGDTIINALDDPRIMAAMRQIFDANEIARLRLIGRHLSYSQNAQRPQADIGDLVEPKAGKVIDTIGRVIGAKAGAKVAKATGGGGAGVGLQAAQLGSSRVKEALGYLVSDRASQMLADAVEDPQLFAALLTEVAMPKAEKILPRIIPYLVGTGSAQLSE